VIEAVFKFKYIKKKVFRELDRVCKPECILATNTSFLPIDQIASVVSRPNKVIGTHFFAPANVMQLLENVRTNKTDSVTIATIQKMAKLLKTFIFILYLSINLYYICIERCIGG